VVHTKRNFIGKSHAGYCGFIGVTCAPRFSNREFEALREKRRDCASAM
jgi:hypothetical protein